MFNEPGINIFQKIGHYQALVLETTALPIELQPMPKQPFLSLVIQVQASFKINGPKQNLLHSCGNLKFFETCRSSSKTSHCQCHHCNPGNTFLSTNNLKDRVE